VSEGEDGRPRADRRYALAAALLAALLAGAGLARLLFPGAQPSAQGPVRPIVQIVRPQPGLPDLSDLVDRLCPSIASIVPHSPAGPVDASAGGAGAPTGFTVSADGWLLAPAGALPQGPLDAVFGDGRRAALTEVRTDPVSGLAILKAAGGAGGAPLSFSDQAFPRVGQFGLALRTPAGRGCSASAGMIASDFLADGGGALGYVRVAPGPDPWRGGMPLVATDGPVVGVAVADPPGAAIPAPIAAVIVDELIRASPAPTTRFGFRAIDYAAALAARLGDVRSGAGVALVQPDSEAERAGLQAGDIVIAVGDAPVSSASELNRALDAAQDSAVLTVARRTGQVRLTVTRIAAGQTH